MKKLYPLLFCSFLLPSCDSTFDDVKKNKDKFIEIGLEESEPINLNDTAYLNRHALFTSRDRKLRYLNVGQIGTIFKASPKHKENIDSVVIFTKGKYLILFDFTKDGRKVDTLEQLSRLKGFRQVDNRLYLGRR